MIFAFKQIFQRALVVLAMVCSLSLGWGIIAQPSYAAAPKPTLADPETMPDAAQAYEEATQIVKDPKMGAEKAYEKEVKVFQKEHPDENIVEKSKEAADSVKTK
jgi:hypothetical protein